MFFNQTRVISILANILRTFCPEEWNYALLTLHSFTSLGFGASFGVSEFVCLYVKLYALIACLLVALLPMKICELRMIRMEKILGPGSASHLWLLANEEEEDEDDNDLENQQGGHINQAEEIELQRYWWHTHSHILGHMLCVYVFKLS